MFLDHPICRVQYRKSILSNEIMVCVAANRSVFRPQQTADIQQCRFSYLVRARRRFQKILVLYLHDERWSDGLGRLGGIVMLEMGPDCN